MNKILINAVSMLIGFIGGNITSTKVLEKKIINREKDVYKFKAYYDMMRKWIEANQNEKTIEELLLKKGYRNIAIYGMGDVGTLLYDELKNSSINVLYGIDKNIIGRGAELRIVEPSAKLEKVDAIIVSAIFAYDEISEMLEKLVDFPVLAMDDLIYEMN